MTYPPTLVNIWPSGCNSPVAHVPTLNFTLFKYHSFANLRNPFRCLLLCTSLGSIQKLLEKDLPCNNTVLSIISLSLFALVYYHLHCQYSAVIANYIDILYTNTVLFFFNNRNAPKLSNRVSLLVLSLALS